MITVMTYKSMVKYSLYLFKFLAEAAGLIWSGEEDINGKCNSSVQVF